MRCLNEVHFPFTFHSEVFAGKLLVRVESCNVLGEAAYGGRPGVTNRSILSKIDIFIKEEEPQEQVQPRPQGEGVVKLFLHKNYVFERKRCKHCTSDLPCCRTTRPSTSGC